MWILEPIHLSTSSETQAEHSEAQQQNHVLLIGRVTDDITRIGVKVTLNIRQRFHSHQLSSTVVWQNWLLVGMRERGVGGSNANKLASLKPVQT